MLKKIMLVILVLMASTLLAQSAISREFADIYVECGLGAMIAPSTPVVAVITNVTWDLGTTAISSDISCPESCKGGQAKVASFIYDSYEFLETDLASGSGDYLDLLVELAEGEFQNKDEFIDSLRNVFAEYVAWTDYTTQSRFEKSEALYDMVYQNSGGDS